MWLMLAMSTMLKYKIEPRVATGRYCSLFSLMVCRVSSAEANLDFTSTALAFVSAKTLQEEDGEDGWRRMGGEDGWRRVDGEEWREKSGGRRGRSSGWRRGRRSGWRRGKQKTENRKDEIPMKHGTRNKKQETGRLSDHLPDQLHIVQQIAFVGRQP